MGIYKKKPVTVFIGRFSPFHNGHAEVLKRALETSNLVLVLVGSSGQARTTKNPFTFEERRAMIHAYQAQTSRLRDPNYDSKELLGDHGILVIEPIYDHPYNDNAWIAGVQAVVNRVKAERARLFPETPVYLTGSDRDQSTWYLKAFGDFFQMDLVQNHSTALDLSATKIRNILFEDKTLAELDAGLQSLVPPSTLNYLIQFKDSHEAYPELVKEYQYVEDYKKSFA